MSVSITLIAKSTHAQNYLEDIIGSVPSFASCLFLILPNVFIISSTIRMGAAHFSATFQSCSERGTLNNMTSSNNGKQDK